MGLWLKCPGCQAQNPLPMKVCPHCGQALDNLSAAQRVYVMGPAPAPPQTAPATVKPPVPAVVSQPVKASPEAGATPKPAKKPRKARKKKG
jgi:hypothetical protein